MICCCNALAGQKLYLLDGRHLKTWTSSFCPWSSCHFQNHQLSIHCWCQGAWKYPKVIFLRVDRGEMSCVEISRREVSTKAWQLLVSIAGSDQKRVRIRWIWMDDSLIHVLWIKDAWNSVGRNGEVYVACLFPPGMCGDFLTLRTGSPFCLCASDTTIMWRRSSPSHGCHNMQRFPAV